jgi:hypothetical protein
MILSSEENTKSADLCYFLQKNSGEKMIIITCSNSVRIKNIDEFIDISQNNRNKPILFNIFIDEIDNNLSSFEKKNYLEKWNRTDFIEKIYYVTATPTKLLEKYQDIQIIEMADPYDKTKYTLLRDSQFIIIKYTNEKKPHAKVVKKVLENEITQNILQSEEGQVWFIPASIKTQTHNEIKDILIKKGFMVFVINGFHIRLYTGEDKFIEMESTNDETIGTILKNIYLKKKLGNKKVAITGNLCIKRGVTLSSKEVVITHAIFKLKSKNADDDYQLAGRICGNTKDFDNFKTPIIFCGEDFKDKILEKEQLVLGLAKPNNKAINKLKIDESHDKCSNINVRTVIKTKIKYGK